VSAEIIPGLSVERLADAPHQARVFGPRPGVHAGTANDPANLFVVDLLEHPFAVGAGFPEPDGLITATRVSPFYRVTDHAAAEQAQISAAMVDQFGDASIYHNHFAWGPNFHGSGPTFAVVPPTTHRWAVVTYLQALAGAGAEQRPNLRVTLPPSPALSVRRLFQALLDAHDLTAAIIVGVVQSAYLSSRDWIKPAVFGERYGLKMDEYRTRIAIHNPTYQAIVAYVERGAGGAVAIHTHVGALWGAEPERLFAYTPARDDLLFGAAFRMKHLSHINHSAERPEEDSTISRATLYLYATPGVERIKE
jgi:hypothetical protein